MAPLTGEVAPVPVPAAVPGPVAVPVPAADPDPGVAPAPVPDPVAARGPFPGQVARPADAPTASGEDAVPGPVPQDSRAGPVPQDSAARPVAQDTQAGTGGTAGAPEGTAEASGPPGWGASGSDAPAPSVAGPPAAAPLSGVRRPAAAPGGEAQAPGPVPRAAPAADASAAEAAEPAGEGRFTVRLANFEGPFDLLLQLISKHKLDVTEVALSEVTDEFMAHIRAMGPDWDLDQTTGFLVVAATLLDLKAARLLPAAEVEDEADLALLEARDLLFARLLQYRAYKQVAEVFSGRLDEEARRHPRTVGLEDHHAELLPDVVIGIGAEGFARLAAKAMQPKPKPQVYVDHIHAPLVSVREQAEVVVALLRERGRASFRELTHGVADTLTVVARFLALLELYREKAVLLDQEDALGELVVTWTGGEAEAHVTDEFDRIAESMEDKA
ncbi:segregation and condensation protein A [Streptomyces spongiicola]|uniref:segregation and condensation protein A n=1 Tax=Streptomyces spongiicola TaxID=1690221 RepID=UPI0035A6027D